LQIFAHTILHRSFDEIIARHPGILALVAVPGMRLGAPTVNRRRGVGRTSIPLQGSCCRLWERDARGTKAPNATVVDFILAAPAGPGAKICIDATIVGLENLIQTLLIEFVTGFTIIERKYGASFADGWTNSERKKSPMMNLVFVVVVAVIVVVVVVIVVVVVVVVATAAFD